MEHGQAIELLDMNLREEILKEHSKAQCNKIVQWIGDSQKRFDELFNLFLNDEYRVTQRAAWPLSYSVIAYPEFIKKNFSKLIKNSSSSGCKYFFEYVCLVLCA